MQGWRVIANRIRGFFAMASTEKELDAELRAHLEMLTEENIRRGMNLEEARYAARREFGGVEQAKELYRDPPRLPLLGALFRPLHFSLPKLAQTSRYTVSP